MIRSQKDLAEVNQPVVERLTQTEKMLLRYEDSREWMRGNQRIMTGVAIGMVAIVAGLWWWSAQRKTNSEHAATYLARILPFTVSGDYRHAIDGDMANKIQGEPIYGLRYIVKQYGSTQAGSQAALALGNAYYTLGLYDSAKMAFDEASSDYPLVKASIEAGRAAILEHSGNKIEAAKLFELAARRDKTNPLDADYLLEAARDDEHDQKDDAIRLYRELLENYPSSQYDDAAKIGLLKLNVEI
jgi:tetratricopeptide (TPR) repeat protein